MAIGSEGDRPLYIRRRLAFAGAGALSYVLLLALQSHPQVTERLYSTTISPLIGRGLSRLTGIIPFSLFEVIVIALVVPATVYTVAAVRAALQGRRRWSNVGASGALVLAQAAGIGLVLFYALWGYNYVRPSLESRLGLARGDPAGIDEIARLTRQLVDAGEDAYLRLHGRTDAGAPTGIRGDYTSVMAGLDSGWALATARLGLAPTAGRQYGTPKSPWSSTVARYIGISGGMYFPFTGEALVVRDLPAPQRIKTVAHEQAHQRGTAVEGDANALAFFVCALSPEPLVRYAGISFARDQMLLELARKDPRRWREEADRMGPGVRRDRAALRAYWARTAVPVGELANRVNDASLRVNRVRGGVQSYGRSTTVFIEFARRNGGSVIPAM